MTSLRIRTSVSYPVDHSSSGGRILFGHCGRAVDCDNAAHVGFLQTDADAQTIGATFGLELYVAPLRAQWRVHVLRLS